jgi:hypothetical protein
MLVDGGTLRGHCHVELRGPDGKIKETRDVHNLVVTTGRAAIIERLDSSPTTAQPSHLGIGTSSTAAALSDTTLTGEAIREAMTGNTSAANVLTMVAIWSATEGIGTWAEAGVFNALTTGTMYARATFTAIAKASADTFQITWTFTLT